MFTRKDFLTGGVALAAAGVFGESAKDKAACEALEARIAADVENYFK